MGFDLTNDRGTYVRFSPIGWGFALTLAESHGWEPEGTTRDDPEDTREGSPWSGEYVTNDGQRVSAADAAAIADACERALSDPDYEQRTLALLNEYNATVAEQVPGYTWEPPTRDDVVKFRERLSELISLCREGSFVIE